MYRFANTRRLRRRKGDIMAYETSTELEVNIAQLLKACLKKAWIAIICAALLASVSIYNSIYRVQPTYSSTSQIYVIGTTGQNLISSSVLSSYESLTKDYMQIIKSSAVLDRVIQKNELQITPKALAQKIYLSNPEETRFISITVTDNDPAMAKILVDSITLETKEYITDLMQSDQVAVIEYGKLPTAPNGKGTLRNAIIFGIIGFLIPMAVVAILYIIYDKLTTSADVETKLGLPVIGEIPHSHTLKKTRQIQSATQKGASKK